MFIPDPGAKSTGSRIQIRNTDKRHFDRSVRQVRSIENLNIEHMNSGQWTGYRCGNLNLFIFQQLRDKQLFHFSNNNSNYNLFLIIPVSRPYS